MRIQRRDARASVPVCLSDAAFTAPSCSRVISGMRPAWAYSRNALPVADPLFQAGEVRGTELLVVGSRRVRSARLSATNNI